MKDMVKEMFCLKSLSIRLLMWLLMVVCCSVAVAQEKRTYAFAHRGDTTLYLDVYRPLVPREDSACVLAVFGGGFVNGERDNELQRAIASELTGRGFCVVSIDYRLGLRDSVRVAQARGLRGMQGLFEYCIRIAVEDCCAASAWVVNHAEMLGVSPRRVVLTGSSAGAIAVLQADYCRANGLSEARVLPAGWKPAAVVPYSGGVMCSSRAFVYKSAPAPTMLMHGTKDKIVAYKRFPRLLSPSLFGGDRVYKQMRRQGYATWIVRFEGIGHEVASFMPQSADLFCGFVNQVFSGRVTSLDATMSDSLLVPTKWTDMNLIDLYR